MKNKLFILVLIVVGLVLVSGNVLADDQEYNMYVDQMREEELRNYEAILPLTKSSNVTFKSGANLGTITHLMDNDDINFDNQIKKLFVTGQLDARLNLDSEFIKELNFETEHLISSYEADFISEYKDSNTNMDNTFTNENDDYTRFDFNAIMNKENSNNLNKVYYGLGFESENKTFTFEDNPNIKEYNLVKNRPYLMRKIYTAGGSHKAIMTREWQLSYVDSENNIGINDKEITSEFQGIGIMFDLEAQMKPTDSLTIGGGYTFKYDYLVGKEDNSGNKLANELGLTNNGSLDETLRESSHFLYLSATLAF